MKSAEFVSELKTLLEARPGLAGVGVHLVWTADVVPPAIVLVWRRVEHEIEWTRMGPKKTLTATVPGMVYTTAPGMQAAADQAETILAEIAAAVTPALPSVGEQTRKADVAEVGWMPFPHDKGGWLIEAEYQITYTSDLA